MEGFFTDKEVQSPSRPDGKKVSCVVCGLYKTAQSPKIPPFGNFKKKILNIGSAPGEEEDQTNSHWQGKAGKLLQRTYRKLGIDLFEDCLNINACHCRPLNKYDEDREPSAFEIECCRKTTLQVIEQYKPKVVILLGDSAVLSVIGNRWKKDLGKIGKWRGWCIPDLDLNTWVCPTFHPDYILNALKKNNPGAEQTIWEQDLKEAFEKRKEPLYIYKEPEIEIIKDLSVLKKVQSGTIAFDYETTGKKPHAPGHKIVCVSIADTEDHAWSFMMPKSRKEWEPFINILINPNVKKIAQNIKYEHTWSWVKLRVRVVGWIWDTMQAAHILDNRQSVSGLKFQTYVQFGVIDYDSEVAPYLKSKLDESANDINQIETLMTLPGGEKKVLTYCGYDSINEYRLANIQIPLIYPEKYETN
jgi:uracil-DNA glycosylase